MTLAEPARREQPIQHLVVLGHPDPSGFCASVAHSYCDSVSECGQMATFRDLYALGFNPLLKDDERPRPGVHFTPAADLAVDLELIGEADVIVLVYPIWFGMPPAIVKGYVDRVLGAGFTGQDIRHGTEHPVLHGKRLKLITASAATRPWLEEKGQWLALRQAFDTYLRAIFSLRDGGHLHFESITPGIDPRFVAECMAEVDADARRGCAELFDERRLKRFPARREASGAIG